MSDQRMSLLPALQVIADLRRDEIVVTTMGSAREWPKLSSSSLDFHYLPSAMGHAPAIALGLALAQPTRDVIAFNGDGGMLMSLGVLVTIVASGATNLTLVVLDNGIYEVTGGQTTAGGAIDVDFAGMGRAAGFTSVHQFHSLEDWKARAAMVLKEPGPRFICLRVAPVGPEYQLPTAEPMAAKIARLRSALGVSA